MNEHPNLEMLRPAAAIDASEVRLGPERGKLRAVARMRKTTISSDAHVATFVRRFDCLRALRTTLLSDHEGEACARP